MLTLYDRIYYKLRKNEIRKAKSMLKKIKIDSVYDEIIKCCRQHRLEYEVVSKSFDVLVLKVKGRNEAIILKFHRTGMVFTEDYEKFILMMEIHGIKKGVYITTGVFEGRIIKLHKSVLCSKRITIADNFHFVKGQLGLRYKAYSKFKEQGLDYFKYLPI